MGNQDWSNIGNNISDMVQQAIDSGDYSKLSQTIEKSGDVSGQQRGRGRRRGNERSGGRILAAE